VGSKFKDGVLTRESGIRMSTQGEDVQVETEARKSNEAPGQGLQGLLEPLEAWTGMQQCPAELSERTMLPTPDLGLLASRAVTDELCCKKPPGVWCPVTTALARGESWLRNSASGYDKPGFVTCLFHGIE
jgi:hypothetical protein